jgi:hypothetical protein
VNSQSESFANDGAGGAQLDFMILVVKHGDVVALPQQPRSSVGENEGTPCGQHWLRGLGWPTPASDISACFLTTAAGSDWYNRRPAAWRCLRAVHGSSQGQPIGVEDLSSPRFVRHWAGAR